MSSVAELFDPHGELFARLNGFRYRDAQKRMAAAIEQITAEGGNIAIEAGTGIGKTFAYLAPALLSGRRTIISTGTKPLQDQIFEKDLPALSGAIGRPVSVVVLKGRANYLCWHRLAMTQADNALENASRAIVDALAQWGQTHTTGDLTEVEDLEANYSLRARVTSTVDNCIGAKCEYFEQCFVVEARRRALDAKIVIVNHHLLLADLALKETGFGNLLGDADTIVVDEAHLLPEIAHQFFGVSASTRELEYLLRDVHGELRLAASKDVAVTALADVSTLLIDLRRGIPASDGRLPFAAAGELLRKQLPILAEKIRDLTDIVRKLDPQTAGLDQCVERLRAYAGRVEQISAENDEDALRWIEIGQRSIVLHSTPLDFGAALSEQIHTQGGNWIFASATLAVGEDYTHFLDRIGLPDAQTLTLPSPFDYPQQACLYLPEGMPDPGSNDHTEALLSHVWPLVEASQGGAFLLFTSHRALETARRWVERRSIPGPLLVQGAGARTDLVGRFREAGNAVLLGTSSFWQGIDVRGQALRLVVIDKLPFAAPNDPYVEARLQAIRRRGGNPFMEFQLPQAVLSLKQGVGRLIRDFDDRGLIVIGDPRLRTRRYGQIFIKSLPAAHPADSFSDALSFARSLASKETD